MENLALIHLPAVTFSSQGIRGRTIYKGIDEFTLDLAERLRTRLAASDVACAPVGMRVNPRGSCFGVSSTRGRLAVSVCLKERVLPRAETAIWVAPSLGFWAALLRRRVVPNGCSMWFLPLFRQAVELEFPSCDLAWMTVDDYAQSHASD